MVDAITEEQVSVARNILNNRDSSTFTSDGSKLLQGEWVTTGPQSGGRSPAMYLGYCVQVRLGSREQVESTFLRHPDGSVGDHVNQGYFRMSPEQVELARSIFKVLPEAEDYEKGFTNFAGEHATGFIIPAPGAPIAEGNSPKSATAEVDWYEDPPF